MITAIGELVQETRVGTLNVFLELVDNAQESYDWPIFVMPCCHSRSSTRWYS